MSPDQRSSGRLPRPKRFHDERLSDQVTPFIVRSLFSGDLTMSYRALLNQNRRLHRDKNARLTQPKHHVRKDAHEPSVPRTAGPRWAGYFTVIHVPQHITQNARTLPCFQCRRPTRRGGVRIVKRRSHHECLRHWAPLRSMDSR